MVTLSTLASISWLTCVCRRAWNVMPSKPIASATRADSLENPRGELIAALQRGREHQGVVRHPARIERHAEFELLAPVLP